MLKEDYCSEEVAKLLKEKEFDGQTHGNMIEIPCVSYITHQMAMKWLREMHNMYINICASGGSLGWWYHIWAIPTHENKLSHRLLRRGEDYPYLSYEDAVDAALKYCLTKLI